MLLKRKKGLVMSLTVRDLFQYDSNFDPAKIRRLTGKSDYKKTDTVDLSRLAALNDRDLSIFVAKKEGKSFVKSIQNDNTRAQVANAAKINDEKQQNNQNLGGLTGQNLYTMA